MNFSLSLKNSSFSPAFIFLIALSLLSSCAQEKLVWDLAKVPVVRTGSPTEIKHNSLRLSAQLESSEKFKEKGFCIAQTPNPTIKENRFLVDSGSASYSGLLRNLWADTLYYIRAYASNATGTGYGNAVEVKTLPGFCPVLQTILTVLSNGDKDLESGGIIIDDGGYPITAKGICWSDQPVPIAGPGNSTNEGKGREDFTSSINGLQPGKTYFIRAYATNKAGTCYGNVVSTKTQVTIPVVSTNPISTLSSATAIGGGNITFDGGGSITARGICWSTSPNPTTNLSTKTNNGPGTGSYSSNLTGLIPNTTYYVRAYAINSAGTAYGNQVSFTTQPVGLPVISTTDVTAITTNSAISGGNISSDGGGNITARGVCWSISQNPTIALSTKTNDGTGSGIFSSSLTGLSPNTTYYVRAYAVNNLGTSYGDQKMFTSTPINLATITTTAIIDVSTSSASSGGNISAAGGTSITARGICWSTSQNPTIALNSKTNNGTGDGIFVASMTNLNPNTTYYVRAYATNSAGTAYGNQINFTTNSVQLPAVSTTVISAITSSTASSGGTISSDGGGTITAKGVCWSTSQNPTISLPTKTNNGSGITGFGSNISGLFPGTTYFVRAYATNSAGTSYGQQISFNSVLADIEGNVYTSVTIGTQVWMRENLKTSKYRNGDFIPTSLSASQWTSTNMGAYEIYNNDPINNNYYGKLYNWYAVADARGLCPVGWHIPTDYEWYILENFVDPTINDPNLTLFRGIDIGQKLKAVSNLWNNTFANNLSGFSALPGGYRSTNSSATFYQLSNSGYWWSLSEDNLTNCGTAGGGCAWYRTLFSQNSYSVRQSTGKRNGYSVRCLKD
jgi:uncharacterized protein (TIGR02145 family)